MATRSRSTRAASAAAAAVVGLAAFCAAADEPQETEGARTRVSVQKDGSKTNVVVEQDLSIKLEIQAKPTATCAATVEFEYQQRDAIARVTGAIANDQCAASGGDYVLVVSIRGANGEVKTIEFPQEWQRSDAEPVKFTHDLPIGPNVDLVSVRSRRLRCTCTEAPAQ